ncbi:MAG: PaaI family thioesterase [Anaerolineales bacterium]
MAASVPRKAGSLDTPEKSLQEKYAPHSTCYGCGPANGRGFRVRSFPRRDEVIAEWTPQPHHEAFPGALNGGVIGTLMDCHSNWTAIWHMIQRQGLDHAPAMVTAEYQVRLQHPTPSGAPVLLRAKVIDSSDDRATVECALEAGGPTCASFRGTFVVVKPGHPAFHRW